MISLGSSWTADQNKTPNTYLWHDTYFSAIFSPPSYILTVLILLAFLYHPHAETQKTPCRVFSARNDLALLWSSNSLQFSPMEYCLIVNLFNTEEAKALHYSPEAKDKLCNAAPINSHMHKDTHMQGVNSCYSTSDLHVGLKSSMLLLKIWPKFSFKIKKVMLSEHWMILY